MAINPDRGKEVGVSIDQPHEVTENNYNNDGIHQCLSPTKDPERVPDAASLQAGVQRADILRNTWSKQGLIMAFVGYNRSVSVEIRI